MSAKIYSIEQAQGVKLVNEIIYLLTHIPDEKPYANDNRYVDDGKPNPAA